MPSKKKIFVLDTNVILHDSSCIYQFEEHDVVIPITVVEELDHPYLDSYSNGLSYLIEKMQGQKIYAHMNLERGERSELADLASNLL
jgi:predicted ribonuclease YlaK